MRADNVKRLIEMDVRGFEVEQNETFISVKHPSAPEISLLLVDSDQDKQVENAWRFVERLEAYVFNAARCHHGD